MQEADRALIFWCGCMPARAAITYTASQVTDYNKVLLRASAGAISSVWLLGLADSETGAFGGPAWWADLRKAHGVLWATYALTGDWRFLAADTVGGAIAWINNFY